MRISPALKLDVIVPVYNEEGALERSIRELHDHLTHAFDDPWHITIADNASTDETSSIARR